MTRSRRALACSLIRWPPWDWVAWQLPASKEARNPDEADVSPFCGTYRFSAGLIVVAHHYLSDAATVERILGPALR